MKKSPPVYMPAIRLFNNLDGTSAFEKGKIPVLTSIKNETFWFSSTIETWQHGLHPAPRRQFVVTLKGHLKFTVSNGETFIITPGIILLAEDTKGEGHSWEMLDDQEWHRLYLPIPENEDSFFVADK